MAFLADLSWPVATSFDNSTLWACRGIPRQHAEPVSAHAAKCLEERL
jgi:hypothetical protein